MTAIDRSHKGYQYGIEGCALVATDFYPLEKAAKIGYRLIDLAGLLKGSLAPSFTALSTQFKELILVIESTRFFCVSPPLFFRDKEGRSFFQNKTPLQCAEKICLTAHLALKTLFGADRVGLIRLGIIGSYAIGYLSLFRWALEGLILLYNIFGAWDGARSVFTTKSNLMHAQSKINHLNHHKIITAKTCENARLEFSPLNKEAMNKAAAKQRKWEVKKNTMQFENTKAWFKIGATISKCVLIIFAVAMAAVNISTALTTATILSLGIISDAIGLTGFFHQIYCK